MPRKKFLLEFIVSASFLWAVWIQLDRKLVAHTFVHVHLNWVVAGLMLIASTLLLHALRWQILLGGQGQTISFKNIFSTYANGYFRSHVFPYREREESAKNHALAANGILPLEAKASLLAGRVTGMAAMMAALLIFIPLAYDNVRWLPVHPLLLWTAAFGAFSVLVAVMAASSVAVWDAAVEKLAPKKAALVRALRQYLGDRKGLPAALGISVFLEASSLLRHYCAARAVGLDLDFSTIAVISTLVMLLTLFVPVTVNGIGLREAGFVFLLSFVGNQFKLETFFALSVVNYLLMFLLAVTAGLIVKIGFRLTLAVAPAGKGARVPS